MPTALQPAIETPASKNATVPVGAFPVTDAVSVTAEPNADGFDDVVMTTLAALIVTDEEVELAPALSNAFAVRLWTPGVIFTDVSENGDIVEVPASVWST